MGCAVLCWLGLDWAESVGLGGLCCVEKRSLQVCFVVLY